MASLSDDSARRDAIVCTRLYQRLFVRYRPIARLGATGGHVSLVQCGADVDRVGSSLEIHSKTRLDHR